MSKTKSDQTLATADGCPPKEKTLIWKPKGTPHYHQTCNKKIEHNSDSRVDRETNLRWNSPDLHEPPLKQGGPGWYNSEDLELHALLLRRNPYQICQEQSPMALTQRNIRDTHSTDQNKPGREREETETSWRLQHRFRTVSKQAPLVEKIHKAMLSFTNKRQVTIWETSQNQNGHCGFYLTLCFRVYWHMAINDWLCLLICGPRSI